MHRLLHLAWDWHMGRGGLPVRIGVLKTQETSSGARENVKGWDPSSRLRKEGEGEEIARARSTPLQEHCDRGSLRNAISGGLFWDPEGRPRLQHALLTCLDVAAAVAHLHARSFVHGEPFKSV